MLVPTGNMRISSAQAHMVAQQLCCARRIARIVSGLDVRRICRCRVESNYVLLSRVYVLPMKLGQRSCYDTTLAIQVRRASCKGYGRFEKNVVHEATSNIPFQTSKGHTSPCRPESLPVD